MQSAQESDLAPLFGDLSQSEKLSEIKPPLPSIPYHFQLDQSRLIIFKSVQFHEFFRQEKKYWYIPRFDKVFFV